MEMKFSKKNLAVSVDDSYCNSCNYVRAQFLSADVTAEEN